MAGGCSRLLAGRVTLLACLPWCLLLCTLLLRWPGRSPQEARATSAGQQAGGGPGLGFSYDLRAVVWLLRNAD